MSSQASGSVEEEKAGSDYASIAGFERFGDVVVVEDSYSYNVHVDYEEGYSPALNIHKNWTEQGLGLLHRIACGQHGRAALRREYAKTGGTLKERKEQLDGFLPTPALELPEGYREDLLAAIETLAGSEAYHADRLVHYIREVSEDGRAPSVNDFQERYPNIYYAVRDYYGDSNSDQWNNAVWCAGLEPNREDLAEEDVDHEIRGLFYDLGRAPLESDFEEHSLQDGRHIEFSDERLERLNLYPALRDLQPAREWKQAVVDSFSISGPGERQYYLSDPEFPGWVIDEVLQALHPEGAMDIGPERSSTYL